MNLLLAGAGDRYDHRIDEGEGRDQGIHVGGHIALGDEHLLGGGGDGGFGAVGQRDHVGSCAAGEFDRLDDTLGIAWEADGDHHVALADGHHLLEELTARGGVDETDVIEDHLQAIA